MSKIKILFDSYHLYHLPQFDPVIDLLSKDGRFEIFLSTCSENKKEEIDICLSILKSKPGKLIFADSEIERIKKIKKLDLDVFICGWSRYPISQFISEKVLVGMIYHGIGVKPSYWRDNSERLNIRFVEGQYRIDQLRVKGVKTKLELTGFTKLDPLFNKSNNNLSQLKKSLGLNLNRKTILFAPTFYPSSIERFGMTLGKLTEDYNVILKPQRKLVHSLAKEYEHIKLLGPETYNIIPYYQISDVLLTEASSTIYEMIALEKPVIVIGF